MLQTDYAEKLCPAVQCNVMKETFRTQPGLLASLLNANLLSKIHQAKPYQARMWLHWELCDDDDDYLSIFHPSPGALLPALPNFKITAYQIWKHHKRANEKISLYFFFLVLSLQFASTLFYSQLCFCYTWFVHFFPCIILPGVDHTMKEISRLFKRKQLDLRKKVVWNIVYDISYTTEIFEVGLFLYTI